MKLQGKVAVVTGASEGIGRAIVEELVLQGAHCVAVSRHAEAKPFLNDLVVNRNCDVGDSNSVKALFDWLKQEYGQLDILVNNAGIWQKLDQLEAISDKTITEVIQTNLFGTIYTTKYGLELLRSAGESAIVNVISKSGIVAQGGQSVYTASKYGVRGFTDVLREDLKDTNIRIMGVYQSGTNTKMFEKTGDTPPIEKFTEPADLASYVVTILAGPEKFWVKELHVDYK